MQLLLPAVVMPAHHLFARPDKIDSQMLPFETARRIVPIVFKDIEKQKEIFAAPSTKYKAVFVNTELAFQTLTYRHKGEDKVYVEQFVAGNADCRLFNTMGEQVESFIATHKSKLNYSLVSPYPQLDTISFEKHNRIPTEQPVKFNSAKKLSLIDKSNRTLYITKELRCICPDTGILFYVNMPSPLGAKTIISHPFSLFSNVKKMIWEYQKSGMPIAKLDASALAGMLITIMREKDFAYCREPIEANKNIARINKKTLTYALNYFFKASSRAGNPAFSLDSFSTNGLSATEQLIGYITVCKGEDTTLQTHHMLEHKYKTVRGKILVNTDDKEAAQLKLDVKSCREMLEKMSIAKPISKELYHSIDLRIKGIGYLTQAGKDKLTEEFYTLFGENDTTNAFFYIINSNQTGSISKDLLSFSQEIHNEDAAAQDKPIQQGKIDFNALMGWNK